MGLLSRTRKLTVSFLVPAGADLYSSIGLCPDKKATAELAAAPLFFYAIRYFSAACCSIVRQNQEELL
jgi:hypothetical protein